MKKILYIFALLLILLIPVSSVLAVHVNGYYRSNGTYVNSYERTAPDGNPYNNYSYPGNYNPNTGSITGGNPDTYLNNYYNNSSLGSSYTYPVSTYVPTPSCPSMSTYDSSSDSCKCYSGYIVSGSSCVNANLYCSDKIGLMSQYNSISKTCECMYGYEYDGSSCVYKSKYSSLSSSTCPLHSSKSTTDSTKCSCDIGYQVNTAKDSCVIAPVKTNAELCNDSFGINSSPTSDGKCQCNTGYEWTADNKSCVKSLICEGDTIKSGNKCITLDESCQNTYGLNSIGISGSKTLENTNKCNCKTGYQWNTTKTSCVIKVEEVFPSGCTSLLGFSTTTKMSCDGEKKCSTNMQLNSDKNECITIPTQVIKVEPKLLTASVVTPTIIDKTTENKDEIKEPVKELKWYQKILSWFSGK